MADKTWQTLACPGDCLADGEWHRMANTIYDCKGSGIYVGGTVQDCVIADNIVHNCDRYGYEVGANANRIHLCDNESLNNAMGDYLDGGTNTVINGVATESANAEEPQGNYPIGTTVDILAKDGNWMKLA